jgi:hypothetical protein
LLVSLCFAAPLTLSLRPQGGSTTSLATREDLC